MNITTSKQARAFLDQARTAGKLNDIPVLGFQARLLPGFSVSDPATLVERSVVIEPIADPRITATMTANHVTRTGGASWHVLSSEENGNLTPFHELVRISAVGTIIPESALGRPGNAWRQPNELLTARGVYYQQHVDRLLEGTCHQGRYARRENQWNFPANLDGRFRYLQNPANVNAQFGAITVTGGGAQGLYVKVRTCALLDTIDRPQPQIRLDLWPIGRANIDAKPYRPAEALELCDWLTKHGVAVVDEAGDGTLAALAAKVSTTVAIWPQPGRPAAVTFGAGRAVPGWRYAGFSPWDATTSPLLNVDNALSTTATGDATAIEPLVAHIGADNVVLHPMVATIHAMTIAAPYTGDTRLRDYQNEAVGLHLAIADKGGYVNTIEPGMGKTICSLTAMRVRANMHTRYRSLVVAEANVREQWTKEAAAWFPEALVVPIESGNDTETLEQALQSDRPVLVVTSYTLVAPISDLSDETPDETPIAFVERDDGQLSMFAFVDDTIQVADAGTAATLTASVASLLASTRWHDLTADEAAALRNTSKQSDALWCLRDNADIAVALTGTPITRSVDDLGRLIAWAIGEREEFFGMRLSKTFPDLSDPEILADFVAAIGPLVFRRDKSEISTEIPHIVPLVVPLEPTLTERALAHAAEFELKRLYEDLVVQMDVLESLDPDDPSISAARSELRAARGALLGGTTLARMASSDPAALVESESAGAALLIDLIEAANAGTGTKRRWAVNFVSERVRTTGQQILIFTDFARVAEGLITDLVDAGVRVRGVLGGGGKKRDRNVADFQAGNVDVLVCTSSGEKGLNLQTASCVIHYDLPWTPDKVIQRTGRVERIGATAASVEIVFPLMVGTIEERVAAVNVSRAIVASQALDQSRGADVAHTDLGRTFSGLVSAVSGDSLRGTAQTNLDIVRALVAA